MIDKKKLPGERQDVKGRIYGLRNQVKSPSPMDPSKEVVDIENVFNRGVIYENNINDIKQQIIHGPNLNSVLTYRPEGEKTILEAEGQVKFEVSEVNEEDNTVLITELDSHGNLTDVTRKYTIDVLAKLIYTNHFDFNKAYQRHVVKYGSDMKEYELSKYWN